MSAPADDRFRGASALVTGGGRGLGRAVALALAARGCAVTVFARTGVEIEATAAEARAAGGCCAAVAGDIACAADVERAAEATVAFGGRIDILINAAGGFVTGPSLDGGAAEMRAMLEQNLVGPYGACVAAARRMKAHGGGRIVNFGSLLSFTAFPERAAYAASKAGLVQLTRVLGVEWAAANVAVNCVVPGMIAIGTPHPLIAAARVTEEQIVARIPAGRRGTPDDIVGPARSSPLATPPTWSDNRW